MSSVRRHLCSHPTGRKQSVAQAPALAERLPWLLGALLLGLLLLALAAPARSQTSGERYEQLVDDQLHSPFARVADRVMPAVVAIRTSKSFRHGDVGGDNPLEDMFRQFFPRDREFQDREFDMPGAGSGFVVSADGYVVTNNHVIEGAEEILVMLPGLDEALPAEIVGQDPSTDLAVIRVQSDDPLPYLEFGNSDDIKVGDWAIAIGNPLGQLEGSLTVGVISAKGRSDLLIQGAQLRYQDFLQTDAAINPGNSGGPLLNIRGEVVGVNTAINRAGQGIGFAIPTRLASRIYDQLVSHGRVRRGYLGIQMTELSPALAEGRDLDVDRGVLVTDVLENTPAQLSGIQVGDVIVSFNGEDVESSQRLAFMVAEAAIGSSADVGVHRDGRRMDVEVTLTEYPEENLDLAADDGPVSQDLWLGIEVVDLANVLDGRAQELVDRFDIRDEAGVVVVSVEPGSPADQSRVRPGDVIVEIVNTPINGLRDYQAAVESYRDRNRPIALLIRRGDLTSYITVDPDSPEGDGDQD